MQIYWTKINKIIEETPVVKTYLLDCPEGYTWQEGSHMHLGLKGFNAGDKPNRSLVRHMSISTLSNENAIGFTELLERESPLLQMWDESEVKSSVSSDSLMI